MAINANMVTSLRVLINDTESPQVYTDARLDTILAVSAMYVKHEIDFDRTFTINIATPDISPDPMASGASVNDGIFANFVILKAACTADTSTFRTKSLAAGISARCGPAVLATAGHLQGFRDLIDFGPCKAYETLKKEHEFGNYTIKAVLSPFISSNFDPHTLFNGGHGHLR